MKTYYIGNEKFTFDEGWPETEMKEMLDYEWHCFYRSKLAESLGEHGI